MAVLRFKNRHVSVTSTVAEANFSTWNSFKLTSYGKFGFSRPHLDGNKLAKGTVGVKIKFPYQSDYTQSSLEKSLQ